MPRANKLSVNIGIIRSPLFLGAISALLMLSLYFSVLTVANSFEHALAQFIGLWYWIVPLVAGFGTQAGLYVYVRNALMSKAAAASMAASGGMSTTSMIACCAHHIADIAPFLGASAAAIFLVKYQAVFMAAGLISNVIGINMMLKIIQTHKLYSGRCALTRELMKINMAKALYFSSAIGAVAVLAVLLKTT